MSPSIIGAAIVFALVGSAASPDQHATPHVKAQARDCMQTPMSCRRAHGEPPALVAGTSTAAPPRPQRRVLLDDRRVRDQASAAVLERAAAELGRRRGIRVLLLSTERNRVGARAEEALAHCGHEEDCLAAVARATGADEALMVRITQTEGAAFVALTRINALRPQISADAGSLVASDADALAFIAEGIEELWPGMDQTPPSR